MLKARKYTSPELVHETMHSLFLHYTRRDPRARYILPSLSHFESSRSSSRQELPDDLKVTVPFLKVGQVTALCKCHPAHFFDFFKEWRHADILRFVIHPVRQKSRTLDGVNLV